MAHGENKLSVCPVCLKRFDRPFDCKQHMKRKRHTTHRDIVEPWAKYAKGPSATALRK